MASVVQVLVASMNQKDHSLLEKMNIQTDAIIGNQTNINKREDISYNGHSITYLNFNERGVGLNRNNSLMRATADICLFADDDMVYCDDYEKIVLNAFNSYPNADVIIFNIKEPVPKRYVITKPFKVNWKNFMRFGTVRIAAKREALFNNGILYNLNFGGGTKYQDGDDTLFLADCVKKGLNIIAVPITIAELTEERQSTWFTSYDEKFFNDKGVLFWAISHRFYKLICFQDAVRHSKIYKRKTFEVYRLMNDGVLKMRSKIK